MTMGTAVVLIALGFALAGPFLYLDWRSSRERKRLAARDAAAQQWREQRRAELAASMGAQEARNHDQTVLEPEEVEAFAEIAKYVTPGIPSAEQIEGGSG